MRVNRRLGLLLPLALLLAASQVARAQDRGLARAFLADAPAETLSALSGAERGPAARTALEKVLAGGRIDRKLLGAAVKNPYFAPYLVDTLIDLETVQHVPGVDRVLQRIGDAHDDAGPRGASFEISVGARFGARLAELSADIEGHEVDARLTDGTLVEVKYVAGRRSGPLVRKATEQLALRGLGTRPVMLVINRELDATQLRNLHAKLGGNASVMQASRTGLLRAQKLGPTPTWKPRPGAIVPRVVPNARNANVRLPSPRQLQPRQRSATGAP